MELLIALFRIRSLLRIERIAREVTAEIDAYDRMMDGAERPPNGDDYNALLSITERLR